MGNGKWDSGVGSPDKLELLAAWRGVSHLSVVKS